MRLTTSAHRDEWLAALVAAFESTCHSTRPSAGLLADVEHHLLTNARDNTAGATLVLH